MASRVTALSWVLAAAVASGATCVGGDGSAPATREDGASTQDGTLPDTGLREVWAPEADTFDPEAECPGGCDRYFSQCAWAECRRGGCVMHAAGPWRDCDDGDPCTRDDRCVPDTDLCRGAPDPCSDDDATTDDACVAGACQHLPRVAPKDLLGDPRNCGREGAQCSGDPDEARCVDGRCVRCVTPIQGHTEGELAAGDCRNMPAGTLRARFCGSLVATEAAVDVALEWTVDGEPTAQCVHEPACGPGGACSDPAGCERHLLGPGTLPVDVTREIISWAPASHHVKLVARAGQLIRQLVVGQLTIEAADGSSPEELPPCPAP